MREISHTYVLITWKCVLARKYTHTHTHTHTHTFSRLVSAPASPHKRGRTHLQATWSWRDMRHEEDFPCMHTHDVALCHHLHHIVSLKYRDSKSTNDDNLCRGRAQLHSTNNHDMHATKKIHKSNHKRVDLSESRCPPN